MERFELNNYETYGNTSIARGALMNISIVTKRKALTQLVALMSAKNIGNKVASKIGTVIATVLVGKL